jgi:hypothetical protein
MAFKSKAVKTDAETARTKKPNPWRFDSPSYDNRNRIDASGGSYGIGSKQPVGHEGSSKQHAECLPQECSGHALGREEA